MGIHISACLSGTCTPLTGELDPVARGPTSQLMAPYSLQSPVPATAWVTGPLPPRRRDPGVDVRAGTWGSERDSGFPKVCLGSF